MVHLETEILKSVESDLGSSDSIVVGSGDYQPVIYIREYSDTLKAEVGSNWCHTLGEGPRCRRESEWKERNDSFECQHSETSRSNKFIEASKVKNGTESVLFRYSEVSGIETIMQGRGGDEEYGLFLEKGNFFLKCQ